ncbi:hypothetical protein CAEBREN_05664 [Caenorhabditis brenneri]|uniref:Uncharacterized protein n=1 Tax=Caenorhabditis brenneri TaxID=135651 RepID=G0P926_CAEBE|nr:hypothetical protein CAEBREN_05664 [Caenorhabditis brenneri]
MEVQETSRYVLGPASPPGNNRLHLLNPHIRIDALKKHTDELGCTQRRLGTGGVNSAMDRMKDEIMDQKDVEMHRITEWIRITPMETMIMDRIKDEMMDHNNTKIMLELISTWIRDVTAGRCDQQEAKFEIMKKGFAELKKMFEAMAGERKECKEKLEAFEEREAAKDHVDGNDGGDDDDRFDEVGDDGPTGNGNGEDYDDVGMDMDFDNGSDEGRDHGSEGRGDAPDNRMDQDHTDGNNDNELDKGRDDGSQQDKDDAETDNNTDQGNEEVEESEGTGGSAPNGEGGSESLKDNGEETSNASLVQPKVAIPKQKTFTLENLQQLLETRNILGLLERINENLAKLAPFFSGPGIKEMSEILSELENAESKNEFRGTCLPRR